MSRCPSLPLHFPIAARRLIRETRSFTTLIHRVEFGVGGTAINDVCTERGKGVGQKADVVRKVVWISTEEQSHLQARELEGTNLGNPKWRIPLWEQVDRFQSDGSRGRKSSKMRRSGRGGLGRQRSGLNQSPRPLPLRSRSPSRTPSKIGRDPMRSYVPTYGAIHI